MSPRFVHRGSGACVTFVRLRGPSPSARLGMTCFNATLQLPRAPQRAARFRAGVLAIFQDLRAIYEDMLHPNGVLMRLLERRAIADCRRIEHDHVGKHSFLQETAMIEPEIRRGQSAELPNRLLQGQDFFVASVFPK